MSRDGNHIDDRFRDELKDIEIPAPNDVWGNIEEHLDRDKKRRAGIITIWTGLAAGLALLISIGVYTRHSLPNLKTTQSAQLTAPIKNNPAPTVKPTIETKIFTSKSITTADGSQPNDNSFHTANTNSMIAGDVNNSTGHHLGNKSLQKHNENSATIETFYNKNKLVADPDFSTPTLNRDTRLSYLSPRDATISTNAKPSIIIQKENSNEVVPTVEAKPVFPEMAETPPVQKTKRWSIAGQVSPQYSYRTSSQSAVSGQNDEKGLVAYSGGLKVDYKTSRRFSLQTGIFYSVMGQTQNNVQIMQYQNLSQSFTSNIKSNSTSYVFSSNNSMGPIVYNKSNTIEISDNLYYNNSRNVLVSTSLNAGSETTTQIGAIIQQLGFIEIPILARYKLIDKKIGLNLIGGVSTNFLVKNNAILVQGTTREPIGKTDDLNTVNYSGTLGFGINYHVLRNIDMSIEPTYKYYLNSISKSKEYNYHPYGFGIFTGVTYKF